MPIAGRNARRNPAREATRRRTTKPSEFVPLRLDALSSSSEESLSIEDTNALRAKLGLAPLNLDDAPQVRDSESGDPNEKLVVEDGFEFTHRVADDLGEKKRQDSLREKLEARVLPLPHMHAFSDRQGETPDL